MNITSKALTRVCVGLLALYLVSAFVVGAYVNNDDYNGIFAAIFAINAGTALLVSLVFGLPEVRKHTLGALRLAVLGIGVVSGFISAFYWMLDAVDDIWLRVVILSPAVIILLVLMWLIDTVNREGQQNKGE